MASVQPQTISASHLGDRYEVLAPLGAGASANVFRVRDLRTGAVRAAKVLKTGTDRNGSSFSNASRAETLSRFEDEFRILRTLHHPHLPEVFDYGRTEDGVCFLIMELVDGEPLDVYFSAHPSDIWVMLYELCETLVFVHARNLLHQDIKPSNILVSRAATADGERPVIKLIDFGLTYRRGVGAAVRLVGTAEYIAPEVARGDRSLTRAVDYYSLGAALFQLLTGGPPFTGSENEVLRAHLEREPVIENEELEWAELYPHVRSLLAKDPQKRLAAFEEFRRVVVGRLTGGIDDLDRSYALARIDSLGMVGKKAAWDSLLKWLDAVAASTPSPEKHTLSVSGVEGVGKRFLTSSLRAEASLRGVRTLAPSEIGWTARDDAAARQPAMMWSRLLEACEKEPVILVVDRPMSLPDEERSFVRLAGTQWELYRSRGRVLPLFFLMAIDSTSEDAETLDYLPSDGAIKLELPALSRTDCEQIVDQFRGAMFDPRDAKALTTYLERFDNAGAAIQGLQRAVLRGGLTFLGQRWKVQPGLLTEIVESHRDDSFARELVASLWPFERRVATLVVAHSDPVPLAWVARFADVDESAVLSVVAGPAKRLLTASAGHVAPASGAVRDALRAGCDPADLRQAHEFLAEQLARLERSVSVDRALAHHLEQLGRVRDAARVHLRLLQAYWSIRPRERPYELIENACRSGLELLEAHGSTVAASTRRHLFCFYLKQWINAFWARNLFTKAKPVIDEWTKRLGERMPGSVAPRYVRSVLETEGAGAALAQLERIRHDINKSVRQLKLRLDLEKSLAMHAMNDCRGAIDLLTAFGNDAVLSRRDSYRVAIYQGMNIEELDGFGASLEQLSPTFMERAYRDGCIDEALLVIGLRARALVAKGRIPETIREIARGLSIAHRAGLSLRANLFYRLASSAYADSNNVRRSQVCIQRAQQLAGSVGMRYMAASGWSRLAEREWELGRFGNARRSGHRALEMFGVDAQVTYINQTRVALLAVDVLSRQVLGDLEEATFFLSPVAPNERGHFYVWQGRDLLLRDNIAKSLESFRLARRCFEEVGIHINVAWAALQEARACLQLLDRNGFDNVMASISEYVANDAPALLRLDFNIVKLSGQYLLRRNPGSTLTFARDCEPLALGDANISLRIELLQVIFRVYARHGRAADAKRVFESYRTLVSEVVANAESENSSAIAEMLGVTRMVGEYKRLDESEKKRGTLVESPS